MHLSREVLRKLFNFHHKKSIPTDFQQVLDDLTIKGYRILGFAYKELLENEIGGEDARASIEKDLDFAGLLLLVN